MILILSTLLSLPIAALDIDITKYLIFFNLDLSSFLHSYAPTHPGLTPAASAITMAVHFIVFMALSYILFIKRNSKGTQNTAPNTGAGEAAN